jgi:hypothetical protein
LGRRADRLGPNLEYRVDSSNAHANFSRYPGTTPPGISRNAYGLLGSASVLVGLRGVGQKANGYIAKTGFVAGMSVVEALADRSLYTTDIAPADALVLAPDTASLFGKCLAPEYTPENYNFCREKLGLSPVTTPPPQGPPPTTTGDARRRRVGGLEYGVTHATARRGGSWAAPSRSSCLTPPVKPWSGRCGVDSRSG